jgi:exodeoxyribonuclease VII small subunit
MRLAKVSLRLVLLSNQLKSHIMAKKKLENLSFEESLTELDTIVNSLEQGELSLEESMALFERGLNLSQLSQTKLQVAEQKVKILVEKNGQQQLTDFDLTADNPTLDESL